MKIKDYLTYDNGGYQILIGPRIRSKNKQYIMMIYNECEKVDFQPSKVNKIFQKYRTSTYKKQPYNLRKTSNPYTLSYALYIHGWYIKAGPYEKMTELLDDYLQTEDKDYWLDTHVKLKKHKRNMPTGEKNIYLISYTQKYRVNYYNKDLKRSLYYGEYDTLEEAIKVRDEKKKQGWPVPPRKRKPFKHDPETRYIRKNKHGKYVIVHNRQHYGTWNTLKAAQEERDWLVENDWNYDNIDLY